MARRGNYSPVSIKSPKYVDVRIFTLNRSLEFRREERLVTGSKVQTVRVKGAIEQTGLGKTTIFELIRTGELESFTIGRARLITVASITRLIERRLSRIQRS